ncbi:MAG: gliding motility protein GldC [Flavobacteriales bacterium]|jgi:gliding motility-associated protein GldC|tara:strand:- start:30597 stop:30917 length:321 start_codon:yes stop_codon:yes gene_type:complete
MKESKIIVNVSLDENNIPEKLQWEATDGAQDLSESKAAFLSFWDLKTKETLRIDLWTKDMESDEMKHFFHQTLLSMSDTLERAIGEEKMAGDLRDFCHHFSDKLLK